MPDQRWDPFEYIWDGFQDTPDEILVEMVKSRVIYTPYVPLQISNVFKKEEPSMKKDLTITLSLGDLSVARKISFGWEVDEKVASCMPIDFKSEFESIFREMLSKAIAEEAPHLADALIVKIDEGAGSSR